MSIINVQFVKGVREAAPAVISVAPFGVLFGALAVENGLTIADAAMMSALMFAGASQMVGLELFGQNIAPWMIILSVFAVNFRHVLYSATLGRFMAHMTKRQRFVGLFLLTDPQFAISEQKARGGETISFAWYMGMGISFYVNWQIATILGATFGRFIQDQHALGITFLLSMYFLCLLMSFRKRSKFVPIVLASILGSATAFEYIGSPWHVSAGAFCGILVAVFWPVDRAVQAADDHAQPVHSETS